jgi:1-acyl-sn-glycerol-3-phosphate acyltransferase
MINRLDRRSQLECLKQCGQLLKAGASVLFFPEGTRSKDGRMHAFKKGAFSVAAKAKVGCCTVLFEYVWAEGWRWRCSASMLAGLLWTAASWPA